MRRVSVILTFAFLGLIPFTLSSVAMAQRGGGGAIVAVDEGMGGGPAPVRKTAPAKSKSTSRPKTTASKTRSSTSFGGQTIGDKYSFLNFEVVEPVKPVHTNAAKAAGAKGLVQVEVLVDTNGRVLTAKARTGNRLLWPEAERAALASILNRPNIEGRPARAIGFLVYRFGPAEDE